MSRRLFSSVFDAFGGLRKNPVLLVPLIARALFSAVASIALLFFAVFLVAQTLGVQFSLGEGLARAAIEPVAGLIAGLVFFIGLVLMLFVSAFFDAGYYAMVSESLSRRTRLSTFFAGVRGHFKDWFVFSFLKGLSWFVLVMLVILSWLAYPLLGPWPLTIAIILFLAGSLFLTLALLFAPPVRFVSGLSGTGSYRGSVRFLFAHWPTVLLAAIIMLFVTVFVTVVVTLFQAPFEILGWSFVAGLFVALAIVLNLLVVIWRSLFLFRVYKIKK